MFQEMRLKEQQLSKEEAVEMLNKATHGTLAINGKGNYPYSVPISFVYSQDKIYFHGAVAGQKHELLKNNPYVSLSIVDLDDVQPSKFTTFYRSVILYGEVRILEEPAEIQRAMELTVDKYSKEFTEGGKKFIQAQQGNFCAYELNIAHMTGKRSE